MKAVDITKRRYFYLALMLGFILGIRDGYISLFSSASGQLIETYPYKAEYLPDADRQALEKGIFIDSEKELAQLMEDYLS